MPDAEDDILTVTDRYVLFARRRSSNSVLRDIQTLKAVLHAPGSDPVILEGAPRTLVMGPSDGIDGVYQPLSGKIETSDPAGQEAQADLIDPDHADLFFPKPFNDEQVQIIRRLEKSEGLVVQGPPGTGKTHTIANVICHMLATGRRVLVVSHGETALKVVRDQLPEGVRDLTISVASSDREGLKQVEKAIGIMLGIVNIVDGNPQRQRNFIRELDARIAQNRKVLCEINSQIAEIATRHLSAVPGSSDSPYEVAKQVVADRPIYDWFTDRPDRQFADTGISEPAITALADARRRVGVDLEFLNEDIPSPSNLPNSSTLMGWHRDLVAAVKLANELTASEPLVRRAIAKLGLEGVDQLAGALKNYAEAIEALRNEPWAWSLWSAGTPDHIRPAALSFLADATEALRQRTPFVVKPVSIPTKLPPRPVRDSILESYTGGKNPFGPFAFKLRAHQDVFTRIRVSGVPPVAPEDWRHVREYIAYSDSFIILSSRWVELRAAMDIPNEIHFSEDRLLELDKIVDRLRAAIVELPSSFEELTEQLASALGSKNDAAAILRHHTGAAAFADELARYVASRRLSVVKERIQQTADAFRECRSGLFDSAVHVLRDVVGNSRYDPQQLERVWTALLAKLSQLRGLAACRTGFFVGEAGADF